MNEALDIIDEVLELIDDDDAQGLVGVIDHFGQVATSCTGINETTVHFILATMIHDVSSELNMPTQKVMEQVSLAVKWIDDYKKMIEYRKQAESRQGDR